MRRTSVGAPRSLVRRRRAVLLTVVLLGAALGMNPVGEAAAARSVDRLCPAQLASTGWFSDVAASHPHAVGIYCIASAGITKGTTSTTFSPTRSVTRGQMASFLRRMLSTTSTPVPDATRDVFADDDGNVHEANIDAMAQAGVIPSRGQFRPGDPLRRDEMAGWMDGTWRWVTGSHATGSSHSFTDIAGNPFEASIAALHHHGVVNGTTDTTYGAASPVTRGQMGSFLARLITMHADAGHYPGIPPSTTTTGQPGSTTTTRPDPYDQLSAAAKQLVDQIGAGGTYRWTGQVRFAAVGAWTPGAAESAVAFWNDVLAGRGLSIVLAPPDTANVLFEVLSTRPPSAPPDSCGLEGPDQFSGFVITHGSGQYWPDAAPCSRAGADPAVWDRVALTHGLGHVLGFSVHTPSGTDVMGSPNAVEGSSPLLDEVVQYLYAVPPGTHPGA